MAIYVEIQIKADLDKVWEATQNPSMHERWDLRFSHIEYLDKGEGEPQRFRYSTRLGFGLRIDGLGESVAEKHAGNTATSSLKFWSDHNLSLIKEGSGYWQYTKVDDSTLFVTGYDYRPRFGRLGLAFDRLVFRPLIGWATAWSFDSMRIWLETGTPPELTRRVAVTNVMARFGVGLSWIYQGLVPKLLNPDAGERAILRAANLPLLSPEAWVKTIGCVELVFGLLILARPRDRGLLLFQLGGLSVLTAAALMTNSSLFVQPFNPMSLNISLVALTCVALMLSTGLPSAKRCKRTKDVRR